MRHLLQKKKKMVMTKFWNLVFQMQLLTLIFIQKGNRKTKQSENNVVRLVDFRAVYLLVDAYHSERVLPVYVVQLLDGITYPCFIAALVCVDRVVVNTMRQGRAQQQTGRGRNRSTIERDDAGDGR